MRTFIAFGLLSELGEVDRVFTGFRHLLHGVVRIKVLQRKDASGHVL